MHQPRGAGQAGYRDTLLIAHDDIEHGLRRLCRGVSLPSTCQCSEACAFGRLGLGLEQQPGLVGTAGFKPCEGRSRGLHHHPIDDENQAEEADEPEQHGAAGEFAWLR